MATVKMSYEDAGGFQSEFIELEEGVTKVLTQHTGTEAVKVVDEMAETLKSKILA